MKLEQQVCNIELSQRLRELGVKQDSYFFWTDQTEGKGNFLLEKNRFSEYVELYDYAAFTVAELGEMLPNLFECEGKIVYLQQAMVRFPVVYYGNENGRAYLRFSDDDELAEQISALADTEADARAAMLIYLIENKLVDPIRNQE